jgi:ComF family protein
MCSVLDVLSILGRETARIVLHGSCIVCERELPWTGRKASCCVSCWSAMPRMAGAKCDSCAMPWAAGGDSFRCISCLDDPLPVGWTEAWGHYRGSLERVLHAFKFERHDFLDASLAELIATVVRDRDFDAIVPVPMHRAKLRQRGYNQAELLGRALGRRLNLRCQSSMLRKRIDRSPQSTLPRKDRAANVRGAFAPSSRVRGRSILLVDDVCTTGETLRACAIALISAGASRVCAAVVAKA